MDGAEAGQDTPGPEEGAEKRGPSHWFSRHKKVVVGAVVGIAAVAAVVALVVGGLNPIGKSQLESDLNDKYGKSGVIPSSYTTASDYKVSALDIKGEQSQGTVSLLGTECECESVAFEADIANESFETHLEGTAQYARVKGSGTYELVSVDGLSSSTQPLRGVDMMTATEAAGTSASTYGSTGRPSVSLGDFSSDLDDSDGTYTSTATQPSTETTWFKTQDIVTSQAFAFDDEQGWQPVGKATTTCDDPTFTFAGKRFQYSGDVAAGIWKGGTATLTLSFGDVGKVGDDYVATADYSIDWVPPTGTQLFHYKDALKLDGTATGKLKTSPGEASFTLELNDAGNAVTFSCSEGSSTVKAGAGTVDTISATMTTNQEIMTDSAGTGNYLKLTYPQSFAELS